MESGAGFFIFLWIVFVGWLMYSSKADKELFLGYMWGGLILIGIIGTLYEYLSRS